MSLQEKLDTLRQESAAKIPADAQKIMHDTTAQLIQSDILQKLPSSGSALPPFNLLDQNGEPVQSATLLATGPLIVSFYRGTW